MYPYNINDPEFADALVDSFLDISEKNLTVSSSAESASSTKDFVLSRGTLSRDTIYSHPSNFPDAKPGSSLITSPSK